MMPDTSESNQSTIQKKNNQIIDIFFSHSNVQKTLAGNLKHSIENLIKCTIFLAHEDLEGGEIWAEGLRVRIQKCDIFLILLSKEYHESNYTDQETGIAYAYDRPMIPVSIDGTIPYGFMNKYQPVKASLEPDRKMIREIAKQIINNNIPEEQRIDNYIRLLGISYSYNNANFLADLLPSDYEYSEKQINLLAEAFRDNHEINESFTAEPKIRSILKKNTNLIKSELKSQLSQFLNRV